MMAGRSHFEGMPGRFEPSLARQERQAEHAAAESEVGPHRRTGDVLDHPRGSDRREAFPCGAEHPACAVLGCEGAHVVMAWRAGMYRVEAVKRERHRVGLDEGERVARRGLMSTPVT